jgi:hypothetical protein
MRVSELLARGLLTEAEYESIIAHRAYERALARWISGKYPRSLGAYVELESLARAWLEAYGQAGSVGKVYPLPATCGAVRGFLWTPPGEIPEIAKKLVRHATRMYL